MCGLKVQSPAGTNPSLRTRAGPRAETEGRNPGLQTETKSGTLAETEQDTLVKSRHGYHKGTEYILDRIRLGCLDRSKVLSRAGQQAEIEVKMSRGMEEEIRGEIGPPQGQSKAGELAEVRSRPGATPARTEEMSGGLT